MEGWLQVRCILSVFFFLWEGGGDHNVALSHIEPPNQTVNVLYKYCLELRICMYV